MRKNFILLTCFIFSIFACTEEEEETPTSKNEAGSCIPIEINYNNTGKIYLHKTSNQKLYYNQTNQLIKIANTENSVIAGDYDYEYKDGNLIKYIEYKNGAINFYEDYIYNSSNQVIRKNIFTNVNGIVELRVYYIFEYAAPLELKKLSYYYYNNALLAYDLYQYTNGLVTKVNKYNSANTLTNTIEYEYDNMKGWYSSFSPNQLRSGTIVFPHNIHNITKITNKFGNGEINKESTFTNTYEYNSSGYPVKMYSKNLDGSEQTMEITYKCE
jgi:hypothetical protein